MCVLCKIKHSFTLDLSLYGSTTLQSRSFLKNIKNFLCKQKLVNNCRISSTHAERKITVCSHKHSFTPYPCLSSYSWTDRITDGDTNTPTARGLEELFFQLCCCVSVFCCGGKQFQVLLTYHTSCAVVFGCTGQFFGCGGKKFQVLLTYQPYQLCHCVSFFGFGGKQFFVAQFLRKINIWFL